MIGMQQERAEQRSSLHEAGHAGERTRLSSPDLTKPHGDTDVVLKGCLF